MPKKSTTSRSKNRKARNRSSLDDIHRVESEVCLACLSGRPDQLMMLWACNDGVSHCCYCKVCASSGVTINGLKADGTKGLSWMEGCPICRSERSLFSSHEELKIHLSEERVSGGNFELAVNDSIEQAWLKLKSMLIEQLGLGRVTVALEVSKLLLMLTMRGLLTAFLEQPSNEMLVEAYRPKGGIIEPESWCISDEQLLYALTGRGELEGSGLPTFVIRADSDQMFQYALGFMLRPDLIAGKNLKLMKQMSSAGLFGCQTVRSEVLEVNRRVLAAEQRLHQLEEDAERLETQSVNLETAYKKRHGIASWQRSVTDDQVESMVRTLKDLAKDFRQRLEKREEHQKEEDPVSQD